MNERIRELESKYNSVILLYYTYVVSYTIRHIFSSIDYISTYYTRISISLIVHHRSDADSLKQNITENSLLLEREKRLKTDLDVRIHVISDI